MAHKAKWLDDSEFARWWEETGESELRQVLHWKWDPIGIASAFAYAADEYDRYAPQIAVALRKGASGEEIAELLGIIEQERMGLGGGSPERLRALAANILGWFEASQIRWVEFGPLGR